ncbi:hypothetical protein GA0074692_5823 [Micromonospora pallida]|uniref:Uncharacterized protein n=1 Tax=Micromonospora pallida TaxID=145854 RepID=A0A1C6TG85_9ACTN|nr:hypothetical protein [Micromonospora pallida]SCL40485.1 hypothetical protein GA0074692_5823 [Micromonospora pallida]
MPVTVLDQHPTGVCRQPAAPGAAPTVRIGGAVACPAPQRADRTTFPGWREAR